MKHKCASMLLASLCMGVLLTGCGKAPDSGENTASVQAADPPRYTNTKEKGRCFGRRNSTRKNNGWRHK